VTGERDGARTAEPQAREQERLADATQLAAHDALRDVERLLDEERKLRERVASEHGADALVLEAEHAAADAAVTKLAAKSARWSRFEEKTEALRAARERRGAPGDADVSPSAPS
jgi:chromosome segregation protein